MAKKKRKKKKELLEKSKRDHFPVFTTFEGRVGVDFPDGRKFFPRRAKDGYYYLNQLLDDGNFRDATDDEDISGADYKKIINSYKAKIKSKKVKVKPKKKIKVRYKKKSKKKKAKLKKKVKPAPTPKPKTYGFDEVDIDINYKTIYLIDSETRQRVSFVRQKRGETTWIRKDGVVYDPDKKNFEKVLMFNNYWEYKFNTDIKGTLDRLEEKLRAYEDIERLKEKAENNIKIIEKARIIFTQIYQDAKTAGLELISRIDNLEEEIVDNIRTEGDKAIDASKDEQRDIFERQDILRYRLASDETAQDKLDVLVWYKEASRLVFQAEKEDNEEYYILALDKFAQILETGVANPEALEGMIYTTKKLAYEGYEEDIKQYEKAIAEEKAKQKRPQELLKLNVPDIGQQ